MTTRKRPSVTALAPKRARQRGAAACLLVLLACHEDYDPEAQMRGAADAGARPTLRDGGTSTSPATAAPGKDGGVSDGGPASAGGQPGAGGTAPGQGGPANMPDGSVAKPPGPVVAACMGHGGETVCDGAMLIRCGMAGDAESRVACTSDVRCRAGLMTGKCGSCDPGAAMCAGAELQECNASGELMPKEPCASAALCSERNKSCNPSQCGKDTYKCEGGMLRQCKADLSGYDDGIPCKMELCSELDKRCNECVPNSKTCVEDTLMVCSADGKGPMGTSCSGTTPKCNKDKCVQCKADTDCKTTGDCQVATCNVGTGTCVTANAPRKQACTGGLCDLLGRCVKCIDDADCGASKYCDWDYTCTDRPPLSVSSLLGCSLTLSANWGLVLNGTPSASGAAITVTLSESLFRSYTITASTRPDEPIVTATSQTRTFSISGATAAATASCTISSPTDSTAILTFTAGSDTMTVGLRAKK